MVHTQGRARREGPLNYKRHSDFETWHCDDGMPRLCCFSLSILLSENNRFSGALMLIPGSHRWFIPTLGQTHEGNWKASSKSQVLGASTPERLREMTGMGGVRAPLGRPDR